MFCKRFMELFFVQQKSQNDSFCTLKMGGITSKEYADKTAL